MTRIVIDTNLYVSALINENSRNRLNQVLTNSTVEILIDAALLSELHDVIKRPKFSKYITESQASSFLELIKEKCTFVFTTIQVKASPDPKDDFLLALCKQSQAEYLLTGNKLDLLALKQFGNTRIITLTDFLSELSPAGQIPTE